MTKYFLAFLLFSSPCLAGMGLGGFPYPGPGVVIGGSTPSPLIYESFTTAWNETTADTSITVNTPAGVVAGDTLVAVFTGNSADFSSSGWAVSHNNGHFDVLTKVAGESEPTSYTFGHSMGFRYVHCIMLRISGSVGSVSGVAEINNADYTTVVNYPDTSVPASGSIVVLVSTKPTANTDRNLSSITRGSIVYSGQSKVAAFPLWVSVESGVVSGAVTGAVGTINSAINDKAGASVIISL